MRLTVHSDYALRLLMCLGVAEGERVTIADVAERYAISKNHLMKVAHALTRGGLVEGVRGRSGGLRLARAAEDIRVGAVLRAVEGDFALVECFQADGGACRITSACRLAGVLAEARDAFLAVLDRYSLADLVAENEALKALLQEAAA